MTASPREEIPHQFSGQQRTSFTIGHIARSVVGEHHDTAKMEKLALRMLDLAASML